MIYAWQAIEILAILLCGYLVFLIKGMELRRLLGS